MARDRVTFQKLAEERLAGARLLLANGHPSGAYYLAGYAIECALKAKIAADFKAHEIPDLRHVRDVYVHDLRKLMNQADLIIQLEDAVKIDPDFARNWATVARWSEQARYQISSSSSAETLLEAVGGNGGLLGWLQNHW
jgi:HEPN domain-containing protein